MAGPLHQGDKPALTEGWQRRATEDPPISEGRQASTGVVKAGFLEEVAFALGPVGGGFSQAEKDVLPSDGACDSWGQGTGGTLKTSGELGPLFCSDSGLVRSQKGPEEGGQSEASALNLPTSPRYSEPPSCVRTALITPQVVAGCSGDAWRPCRVLSSCG